MRRRVTLFAGVMSMALALMTGAAGAATQLRMAALEPDGSSWTKSRARAAQELASRTEDRVSIKWSANAVMGDERDVVRKMNLGQLDGAALRIGGLSMIDESIGVLQLPRLFANVEEYDYVLDKMWPYFQQKFEAKGYMLLGREDVGWTYAMSRNPVTSAAALKSQKVRLDAGDATMRSLYKKLGISGVPLGLPEVEPALTTGRVNTVLGSPLTAVALQWNTKVTYLANLPIDHGIGAVVISLGAFKKLSKDDQNLLLKIDRGTAITLRKQVRKDNESAKKQMERKGVAITEAPAEMRLAIDRASAEVWRELTGKAYSRTELETVLKARSIYRTNHPAG